MKYYEPMFCICSDEMPFGIRIEVSLKYKIDGKILDKAVNTSIKRYPYFSIKLLKKDGYTETIFNELPIKVFNGSLSFPLGDEHLNYHMLTLSYQDNKINFYTSHVITDGAGFTPFVKTVLYYYLSEYLGEDIPHNSIRLIDEPFIDDEIGNPYPEKELKEAKPYCPVSDKEFFRLLDGGYVTDDIRVSYDFRVKESDVMRFSHENDASPCVLFSSIMAKAIWSVHPNEQKDIISAISFNMRPALGNKSSYRLVCNAINVRYPKKFNEIEVRKICTCTRGSILIQSQPEQVLYYSKMKKEQIENILNIKDPKVRKETLSKLALKDSINNTFSVSYVGRVNYDGLLDHIEKIKNFTDGSTYKSIFIEISSFNGWFYITMQQGFSNDIYYKALINQLRENNIEYVEEGVEPLITPLTVLP